MMDMQSFADVFPPDRIHHHFIGGVYAKELRIPAGFVLVTHEHKYDHMSVLAKGYVEVEVAGEVERRHGPHVFNIRAGQAHTVRAISDAVWLCIHATDVADPALVDETLIVREIV